MTSNPTYFLYLSSFPNAPYLTSNADPANVKFMINWDTFFNRDNYRYKSCRVRFSFRSNPCTTTNYNYAPNSFTGFIAVDGLRGVENGVMGSVPIGLFNPVTCQYLVNNVVTTATTLQGDDLTSACGHNFQMPTGFREIAIHLYQNTYGPNSTPISLSSVTNQGLGNWNLQLMFELYDPVDEI